MSTEKTSDYEKALQQTSVMPRFYLAQEVRTKDGKGIIVGLTMHLNGLYIVPESSKACVWYSTEQASAVNAEGGKWVSYSYKLTELSIP